MVNGHGTGTGLGMQIFNAGPDVCARFSVYPWQAVVICIDRGCHQSVVGRMVFDKINTMAEAIAAFILVPYTFNIEYSLQVLSEL